MKKKLILYISKSDFPGNITVASTLAWLSKIKSNLFDNYYDSYHKGIHFGGGDPRNLETGQLTGGTVSGDRHFEAFYFLLHRFDVSILSFENTLFSPSIKNLNIPVLTLSDEVNVLYKTIFSYFDASLPSNIVMLGSNYEKSIAGLNAYLYPEIYYRQAIGVLDSIKEEDLSDIYQDGSRIFCLYVDENVIKRLKKSGYNIEIVDRLNKNDDYCSLTKRVALRWSKQAEGWILGDPILVSHWLPKACEENLLSIYSVPQNKIISEFGDIIASKGKVIYGRQYSDQDFFELSKLNQCLQVIDPCRPPFQSVKHANYNWQPSQNEEGFYDPEYSDEELKQFARNNKVLVSLMFWSGMIREVANYYNLMELFALTGLRCGLVLTAQSYEYMMHSPFELIVIPLERGGVFPLVEPVLGSCGVGVGIESHMTNDRLEENVKDGLDRILEIVKKQNYLPRGWWPTMDANLEKLSYWKKPKAIRFLRYPPYIQIRFNKKLIEYDDGRATTDEGTLKSIMNSYIEIVRQMVRKMGLSKYFEPYRPYEFYKAGPVREDIIKTAKSAGLKYMFTKSGFNSSPDVKYRDEDFIVLNYTAGQWDGWTPFETINDVSDLIKSEKILLKTNKPGWIMSTIDSCLWAFSGEFWKRGCRLYDIAKFCTNGGNSGSLINVKPFTIARYARIIAEERG